MRKFLLGAIAALVLALSATTVVAQVDTCRGTAAAATIAEGGVGAVSCNLNGGVRVTDVPATPITATSGLVNNATAAATLAGVSAKTTYITGFDCSAGGATAAAFVSIVVSGTITGSMTYRIAATNGSTFVPATSPLVVEFSKPIPASATNTAVVVTMGATGAGGTNAVCNARGFQQ